MTSYREHAILSLPQFLPPVRLPFLAFRPLNFACFWMLFCLSGGQLSAQAGSGFIHYSTSDGLPGNTVFALATDREGFLWVGTLNGLARYDGRHFVPFNQLKPDGNPMNRFVRSLFVDSRGFLWCKEHGTNLYRIHPNTLEAEHFNDTILQCPSLIAPNFFEDAKGNVWLPGSWGMVVFDPRRERFEHLPLHWQNQSLQPEVLVPGNGDTLWFSSNKGAFAYRTGARKLGDRLPAFPGQHVHALAKAANGNLFLARWFESHRIILQYDPVRRKTVTVFDGEKGSVHPIVNTDVWQFYNDGKTIWAATNSGGACELLADERRFLCHQPLLDDPGSLWSKQVFQVHKDPFDNIWVGTSTYLSKLPAVQKQVELLTHQPGNANSLINRLSNCVIALDDSLLAIGTVEGISVYNRLSRTYLNFHLPHYANNKYNDWVTALAPGRSPDDFWAGSWSGLIRLDKRTGRILERFVVYGNKGEQHPASVKHFDVGGIHALFRDRQGALWISNNENKVRRLNENVFPRRFEYFDTISVLASRQALFGGAYLDWDDRCFLLGTHDGILAYDYTSGNFQPLEIEFPHDSSSTHGVNRMIKSGDGSLLAMVNQRLYRIQLGKDKNLATPLGLPSDKGAIRSMQEDKAGFLWIFTDQGVLRWKPGSEQPQFFEAKYYLENNTGLITDSHQLPARDADGQLYFIGSKGVSVIQPDAFLFERKPPFTKIISLKINDLPPQFDTAIHKLTTLRLPHDQNNLTFEFAAIGSPISERTEFSYWLEGSAQDWVSLGAQNKLNFSQLAPGDYTLHLRSANSDGVWDEQGVSLKIFISPPWYRTFWAYFGYLLLSGGTIFGITRYRFQQRLALEKMRTRIASDLHDEVGSSLSHLNFVIGAFDLENSPEQTAKGIEKSKDIMRKTASDIRDVVWAIDARRDKTGDLLDRMEDFAFDMFSAKNIAYHFMRDGIYRDAILNPFVRQNIYLIFKEAVNNIAKHSNATEVHISLSQKSGILEMMIADNGSSANGSKVKGQGLENMKLRATRIGGALEAGQGEQGFVVKLRVGV